MTVSLKLQIQQIDVLFLRIISWWGIYCLRDHLGRMRVP